MLYWCKSTATDAEGAARFGKRRAPVIARVEYGVYRLLEFSRPPYTPRGVYASTTAKEVLSSDAAALLACAGDLAGAREGEVAAAAATSPSRAPVSPVQSMSLAPLLQSLRGTVCRDCSNALLSMWLTTFGGCARDLQALQVLPLAAQHLWGAAEQNSDRVSVPESPCAGAARGSSAIEDRDWCHLPDPWLPLPEFWLAEAAPQGPANNPALVGLSSSVFCPWPHVDQPHTS